MKENHEEYKRGIIISSISWICLLIFLGICGLIDELIKWGIGGRIGRWIYILYLLIAVWYFIKIIAVSYILMYRNRFKISFK